VFHVVVVVVVVVVSIWLTSGDVHRKQPKLIGVSSYYTELPFSRDKLENLSDGKKKGQTYFKSSFSSVTLSSMCYIGTE
jgi:hypothetical protein